MNSKSGNVRDSNRINLRLSAELFAALDTARTVRPGNVSRNTWITEAIVERLTREGVANDRLEGEVANG
jgi:predicted HicB family RNase H-like nuclease